MLEKINQIQELLNVPNVDANPKTALANMKILNLLVSMRAEAEQLTLYGVVSSFLTKQAESRNTPIDELYLRLDNDKKEIDLHYDEDNEGHLKYMDSYK
jgi:hypothetical protein